VNLYAFVGNDGVNDIDLFGMRRFSRVAWVLEMTLLYILESDDDCIQCCRDLLDRNRQRVPRGWEGFLCRDFEEDGPFEIRVFGWGKTREEAEEYYNISRAGKRAGLILRAKDIPCHKLVILSDAPIAGPAQRAGPGLRAALGTVYFDGDEPPTFGPPPSN
jgi:hypothetical protein